MFRAVKRVEQVVKFTGRRLMLGGRGETGVGENFLRMPTAVPPLSLVE